MSIGTKAVGHCSICGVSHDRYRDADHTRFASYCHSCHASYMRKTRPAHAELMPLAKYKANARAYANTYQRRGRLAPKPCVICGSDNTEKHHPDYDKPLKVIWICKSCHVEHHREEGVWVPALSLAR